MDTFRPTRREFLGQASCAAVGSTALASTLLNLFLTGSASAQGGVTTGSYRAIVCLFLPGGNDAFNFIVPRGDMEYAEYLTVRQDLALAQSTLLPIFPDNDPGRLLGMHPGAPELQEMFNGGSLALLANVGSLVRPTSKTDFINRISLPNGLFSHSDQQEQWQSSIPNSRQQIGWGGRMADLLAPTNPDSPISMNISVAGNNIFQVGQSVVPYTVDQNGALAPRTYPVGSLLRSVCEEAIDNLVAQDYSHAMERTFNQMRKTSRDAFARYVEATAVPLPAGVMFPDDSLGRQLLQVARVIQGRNVLGVRRQVFYVQWGGWDFHDNVLDNMALMIPVVSRAIKAFHDAMIAMGVANNVTLFTASDFGRSLTSNRRGSDHAWGGNHVIVGGAVRGKRVYGQYPDLYLGGPLETGRGSIIPTTSVDQMAAELALWMGVDRSNLSYVLPNIANFYDVRSSSAPIGFLA